MPDTTRCQHCQHTGLVRQERVIKGDNASIVFHCGHCDRIWTSPEADAAGGPSFNTGQADRSR